MNWDPVYVVNLILCIFILVLGVIGFARSRYAISLYIAIAFGLFGLSHLAVLLALSKTLLVPLIYVRILAYLVVLFAVYDTAFGKKWAGK